MVGRVLPVARELAAHHEVYILQLTGHTALPPEKNIHHVIVGQEPFARGTAGKQRQSGLRLVRTMAGAALGTARELRRINPDVIVIVKPLPANVAGTLLALSLRQNSYLVLDVDDFELTANVLTTLTQRAAIHWSERAAARYAHAIIAATPFLADHFEQLKPRRAHVHLIPTGADLSNDLAQAYPFQGQPTLLYVGSLSLRSGHRVDLLPDILRQVQRTHAAARLIIAGTGDDEAMLRRKCDQLGVADRVEWTGRFSPGEVPALVARSHMLLDPVDVSITARAKSSFRVVAAAQLGWPVVTSNIGVRPHLLPELLQPRCFAQPASAASYAALCNDFIAHPLTPDERRALQRHGQQYRWSALAEQYAQCLTYAQQ